MYTAFEQAVEDDLEEFLYAFSPGERYYNVFRNVYNLARAKTEKRQKKARKLLQERREPLVDAIFFTGLCSYIGKLKLVNSGVKIRDEVFRFLYKGLTWFHKYIPRVKFAPVPGKNGERRKVLFFDKSLLFLHFFEKIHKSKLPFKFY